MVPNGVLKRGNKRCINGRGSGEGPGVPFGSILGSILRYFCTVLMRFLSCLFVCFIMIDCCAVVVKVLQDCCENAVGLLWDFCGIPVGLLRYCCGITLGLLWHCCGYCCGTAGLL